jgi:hypothetical protein
LRGEVQTILLAGHAPQREAPEAFDAFIEKRWHRVDIRLLR